MQKEWIARILVFLLVAVAIGVPVLGWWNRSQGVVVHAQMAETGGWNPDNLTVEAGQPLHLRLTSDDVAHSFAIGQSDRPVVDVLPGETTEVTLVFDRPGKYTFYCTRWCSVNHWRMRGTIEITTPGSQPASETIKPPLYVRLGLDIDAEHHAKILPDQKPSVARGAVFRALISPTYLTREYYLSHTPEQAWRALRGETSLQALSDQELWDLTAFIWNTNITSKELEEGRELFIANCAACHGESGKGDGVFADDLSSSMDSQESDHSQPSGLNKASPADFSDPEHMLSTSSAHLQGKIIRGGMGTGMPYWGPIFTEEQTWALVAYLWTFQSEQE